MCTVPSLTTHQTHASAIPAIPPAIRWVVNGTFALITGGVVASGCLPLVLAVEIEVDMVESPAVVEMCCLRCQD
jgi:hypothetical protein